MNLLKVILFVVILLAVIVTCDNVQAIREATTTEQSIYEKTIRNFVSKGEEQL